MWAPFDEVHVRRGRHKRAEAPAGIPENRFMGKGTGEAMLIYKVYVKQSSHRFKVDTKAPAYLLGLLRMGSWVRAFRQP